MAVLQMPVGTESFRELREKGQWYCDKTGRLAQFIRWHASVSQFTRPRRFGKTLTMDTLAEFLDLSKDSRDIFAGLDIMKDEDVCSQWMNKYPVIFLNLKSVEGRDFESAMQRMHALLSDWVTSHSFLLSSPAVDEDDKEYLRRIQNMHGERPFLSSALFCLSQVLSNHYGRDAVILIDDYDMPIAKAETHGFYSTMLNFMRGFLGDALKSNSNLEFGVLTGCLFLAGESFDSSLNNVAYYPLSLPLYEDFFGFTKTEVDALLEKTALTSKAEEVRGRYGIYRFGCGTEIYCPWDVILYVDEQHSHPGMKPFDYWKSTSDNGVVWELLRRTKIYGLRANIERLINGDWINEQIPDQLTYDTLYKTAQNIWSLLYQTGYLTKADKAAMARCRYGEDCGYTCLVIPNNEIRSIYIDYAKAWFRETVQAMDRTQLFESLWSGNAAAMTHILSCSLFCSINYYDWDEYYYHDFLAGIFSFTSFDVASYREAGGGRNIIQIVDAANRRAAVIVVKIAKAWEEVEDVCSRVLAQIDENNDLAGLSQHVMSITKYAAAFFHKDCLVRAGKTEENP